MKINRFVTYVKVSERFSSEIKAILKKMSDDEKFCPSDTLQATVAKKRNFIEETERLIVNELTSLLATQPEEQDPATEDTINKLFDLQRRISEAYSPVMNADMNILRRMYELDECADTDSATFSDGAEDTDSATSAASPVT